MGIVEGIGGATAPGSAAGKLLTCCYRAREDQVIDF
jgi:hypothetical protein